MSIAITSFAAGAYYAAYKDRTQVKDVSVLYGGQTESGYQSAGYMINQTKSGGLTYCGAILVDKTRVITSAHCIDDAEIIQVGFGNFTTTPRKKHVVKNTYKTREWISGNVFQDYAILEFDSNETKILPAELSDPKVGCNYRVIAYGRTENENINETENRLRKTAQICIEQLQADIFYLKATGAGICVGDSGSPIFEEKTNKVVGIISSIITDKSSNDNPCYIGNSAVGVSLRQNYQNLSQNILFPDRIEVSSFETDSQQANDFLKKTTIDRNLNIQNFQNLMIYIIVFGAIASLVSVTSVIYARN